MKLMFHLEKYGNALVYHIPYINNQKIIYQSHMYSLLNLLIQKIEITYDIIPNT